MFHIDFSKPLPPPRVVRRGFKDKHVGLPREEEREDVDEDSLPMLDVGFSSEFIKEKMTELTTKLSSQKENIGAGSSILSSADYMSDILLENRELPAEFMDTQSTQTHLPITTKKADILNAIKKNCVTLINGGTGCGKTTQVPQYILDDCYTNHRPCNIIVTQPRRLAAVSIANRVCEERNWPKGTICGYQIGQDAVVSPDTRLLFCTTGILLQKILHSRSLSDFTHIFLDEVHERTQEMDFLLLLIRLLLRESTTKIILMSATMDDKHYVKYFKFCKGLDIATVKVEATSLFYVQHYYLDNLEAFESRMREFEEKPGISKIAEQACLSIIAMSEKEDTADHKTAILIFLPGIFEIRELAHIIRERVKNCVIFYLHSSVPKDEQDKAMLNYEERKIILSTNIAESSITVPDVKIVINFCLSKSLQTDHKTGFSSLRCNWISHYEGIQRAGRVGRVAPGRVYRLVPKSFYMNFDELAEPEMTRAPLETTVLRAKALRLSDPIAVLSQAITPPGKSDILRAILQLKEAGALTATLDGNFCEYDGEITFLGNLMTKLPLCYRTAKLVALGYACGIPQDAVVVAAYLTLDRLFLFPEKNELNAYRSLRSWANGTNSDAHAALNAFQTYQSKAMGADLTRGDGSSDQKWAKNCFLQLRTLKEMKILVNDILRRLKECAIDFETTSVAPASDLMRSVMLKIVIAGAFYGNYYHTQNNVPEEEILRELNDLDPLRTVYFRQFPRDHCGPLFVNDIRRYFEDCVENRKPYISFYHEKVFVEFPPELRNVAHSGVVCESIAPEMYAAAYKTILHKKLVLRAPGKDRSMHLAKQYGFADEGKKLNFIADPEEGIHRREVTNLPKITKSDIDLQLIQICDPGYFLASYRGWNPSYHQELEMQWSKGTHEKLKGSPGISCVYLVNRKGSYVRARVDVIHDLTLQVFYIDIGFRASVRPTDLFIPDPAYASLVYDSPAFVLECRLSNVEPAIDSSGQRMWSKQAHSMFESIVKTAPRLKGKVFSVVNGVVNLELIAINEANVEISVNKLLIEENFANSAPEGYYSTLNHKARTETNPRQVDAIDYFDKRQRMTLRLPEPEYPDLRKEIHAIRSFALVGPASPLTCTLYPVRNVSQRKVTVTRSSVNSVIFNTCPQNYQETLLVSYGMHNINQADGVSFHNSTLMPEIRGLTSLIALIFAPCVQLRRDMFETRYTSALCGMGCTANRKPIHPDHDFNVVFDVEFTAKDLTKVNKLRQAFSYILYTSHEVQPFPNYPRPEYIKSVKNVQECFKDLFTAGTPRNPYPPDILTRMQWDGPQFGEDPRWLYPNHRELPLRSSKPLHDELGRIYKMLSREIPFEPVSCPLCGRCGTTFDDLKIHITSVEHARNESHLLQ